MKARTRIVATIPSPAWGDVGPFAAQITPHPFLYCYCGQRLWWGDTPNGAPLFACRACQIVCDRRRVA
jgi:hypothetical protein